MYQHGTSMGIFESRTYFLPINIHRKVGDRGSADHQTTATAVRTEPVLVASTSPSCSFERTLTAPHNHSANHVFLRR